MKLDQYTTGDYSPGASFLKQVLWFFLGSALVESRWFTPSSWKVFLLRCFGAKIGKGVRVKPGVRIKFPWRLRIGDHSWLGENTWIDNLACVSIGSHCCLSQETYLCTGNHDWSAQNFDLKTEPIVIEDHSWVGARSSVAPGVTLHSGCVLSLGSVACSDLEGWKIYCGNPATCVGDRVVNSNP